MGKDQFSFDNFINDVENEDDFSFNNFMKKNAEEEFVYRKSPLIGVMVESKITTKKLVLKMEVDDGESNELALDFKENGGTVVDINGKHLLIEVESGSFYLSKNYVEKM